MCLFINVLFVYIPAMSELPQPLSPIVISTHFRHLLRWEPGPGTPTGVYYRVTVINNRWLSFICVYFLDDTVSPPQHGETTVGCHNKHENHIRAATDYPAS